MIPKKVLEKHVLNTKKRPQNYPASLKAKGQKIHFKSQSGLLQPETKTGYKA